MCGKWTLWTCRLAMLLALPVVVRGETQPGVPLTAEAQQLKTRLLKTLGHYYARPLDATRNSPWNVIHQSLAFGVDTELRTGQRQVNAIGWLCWNQSMAGQRLFAIEQGLPAPLLGAGVEGHHGQFLAVLAQSRVRPEYEMRISGRVYHVADLVRHEQGNVHPGSELTFQLIGLSHYVQHDAQWQNRDGVRWDIARMIREELAQPIHTAACGGSHRLMGLSYAVRKCERRGVPIEGEWARAAKYLDDYGAHVLALQNPDGSFSSRWYVGRGQTTSPDRSLETSGHTLEWLVFSLPRERLHDPRVVRAVDFLNRLLWNGRSRRWGAGPLGHALHALVIYDRRALGGKAGAPAAQLLQQTLRP